MEWRKISTLVGVVILNIGLGYPLYVGNLSVYTTSFAAGRNVPGAQASTAWLLALFNVFKTLGIFGTGFISNQIGKMATIVLGMVLFSVGNFMSYFTIKVHMAWFLMTSACLPGFTCGLSTAMSLRYLLSWADNNMGQLTSLISVSVGIGAGCINLFITWFINPDNKTPMASHGSIKHFDGAEVLDKVPVVFLYLGTLAFLSQLLGLVMMRERPEKPEMVMTYRTNTGHDTVDSTGDDPDPVVDETNGRGAGDIIATNQEEASSRENSSLENSEEFCENVEPKQLFRRSSFYFISVMFMAATGMSVSFFNSYKLFGETVIDDDTFLTTMAVAVSWTVIGGRVLWGFLIDVLRATDVFMAYYVIPGLCFAWLYLIAVYNKWMFFFCNIVIGCSVAARQVLFPQLVLKYFGKKYFTTNVGVVMFSGIIMNLILPYLLRVILETLGWSMYYDFPFLCALLASICIWGGLKDK